MERGGNLAGQDAGDCFCAGTGGAWAFTEPGDAVLLQQPVYYPFSQVIRDNGRKIVDNTLVQGEDGRYRIDFTDFEEKIRSCKVKLFFLCNPHNPVGRVWTKEELRGWETSVKNMSDCGQR